MTIMINPGSGPVPAAGAGWTNTPTQARRNAEEWLAKMVTNGCGADVELLDDQTDDGEGRWTFTFRHAVTKVTARLDIHGIDDMAAFQADNHPFPTRVYWNGSSSANPELDNFLAAGFVATFRPVTPTTEGTDQT